MTHEITTAEANFVNGSPTMDYTKIYKCFQSNGNGLLFRVVNETTKKWAFYNDTADTTMKVTAVFHGGSRIRALHRARLTVIPKEDGTQDDTCEQEVTLEVEPFRTELFIEGTANGFSMSFQSEAAPAQNVQFEYRRPAVPYDKIYKCFKNNGNGLLFRLVDEHEKKWSFYNDTRDYVMSATVEFAEGSAVRALGKTEDRGAPSSNRDGVIYYLEIAPGATEPFICGDAANYRLQFAAEPLSNDRPVDPSVVHYENGQPDHRVVSLDSKIYKCFKNNGNGLLFRLVDEEKRVWAFYNDTTDYVMKAIVRFPEGEDFRPSHDAAVEEDPEEPTTAIVSMEIPPVTTRQFITGLPTNFEVAFSAESVNKSLPEENPVYENKGPDPAVMDYMDVYRCFKNNGNGLLFRLSNKDNSCWGFYNDTTDTTITARVAFDQGAKVRPLNGTTVEQDSEMGRTFVHEISPLATVLFVEGELGSFVSKFTAVKRVSNVA